MAGLITSHGGGRGGDNGGSVERRSGERNRGTQRHLGEFFAIGLVATSRMESFENSLSGSTTESMASMSSAVSELREKMKMKKKKI